MKHLIISAHPNPQSFNRALVEEVIKATRQVGAETVVRDLYTLDFNPVLSWSELNATMEGIVPAEIKFEQKTYCGSRVNYIHLSALVDGVSCNIKGYLDRILSYGFAYQNENGVSVGLLRKQKNATFYYHGK